MSLTNTDEVPHGIKRPYPESVDNPPTKKAKSSDGHSMQESNDDKPSMSKESELTTEKNNLEKSPTNELEREPNDYQMKENIIKSKTSESNEQSTTNEDKNPEELEKLREGYLMNVNGALIEAHQGTPFRNVVNMPVTVLQAISDEQAKVLSENFEVRTVRDLANWKFYQVAYSMLALTEVEEKNGRHDSSLQNINDAVDKQFEKSSITTIMEQKAQVLQGIGKFLQLQMSKKIGITTMMELANFKPAKYAAALVALADFETAGFQSKTTTNDRMPLSTFRPVVG